MITEISAKASAESSTTVHPGGTTAPPAGATVRSGDQPATEKWSSPATAQKRSRQKSAITNGSQLLLGVRNTNAWARRCKDIIAMHLSDLGGVDACSAAERSIIRRAAVLTTELEMLEARFANDGQASADDLDLYQRTAGNLRRLFESIGLERRAKVVGPSLGQLLRADIDRQAGG